MPRTDPHLNVFHAYRGAAKDDSARERQLEDNLTRALAITLSNLGPGRARDALLDAVGASAKGYRACLLQVGATDAAWPSDRGLTVIHGGPDLRFSGGEEGGYGRADAVILGDRSLTAIESKVGDRVSRAQLAAHGRTLGVDAEQARSVTWDQLARVARSVRTESDGKVGDFLLGQFEEYLRMNGFGGLGHEHFAYFAMSSDERELHTGVKEALDRILRGIGLAIGAAAYPDWDQRRRGHIRDTDTSAWATLEPPGAGAQPHLTVIIDASRIGLLANIETEKPHRGFRRAWQRDHHTFIEYLRSLAPPPNEEIRNPWRLDVMHRIPVQVRRYRDEVSLQLSAPTATNLPDDTLASLIDAATAKPDVLGVAAPQISLTREYGAADVLADPDSLTDRLVADAREAKPFFSWLANNGEL